MKLYQDEIVGQRDFYGRIGVDPDLSHYTDGVDRGNLYENKLAISDINKTLFQAIKYASSCRERGERLPANLILNDLNSEVCYIFQSADFLQDIEKIYFGAASKNNDGYKTDIKPVVIDYSTSTGLQQLLEYVNSDNFVKYHVDHNDILGLAHQFYKYNQNKDAFIKGPDAEIRKPSILADRIYAYDKDDNEEFRDIMDCLNPALLQREQGAYYTPPAYVAKMHEMLKQAIAEIPDGKDYVIIDRCAGVGNLQEGLPEEILEHCVLSTIEFNEYQLLRWKFGDSAAVVIPNTDAIAYDIIPAESKNGKIVNDYIREKVNDPNCVVILMENPPFSEAGSGGTQNTGKKENAWKKSWVCEEMKKEIKGVATNDLANLFIWSGFKYYLKSPEDSYILYSPTKYWRNQNLVNKSFRDGFLCNRLEFHAKQSSAMGCIWWQNVDDFETTELALTPYDLIPHTLETVRAKDPKTKEEVADIVIKKTFRNMTEDYDNREFDDDAHGVMSERDGSEFTVDNRKVAIKPIFNDNMVGYLDVHAFLIDRKTVSLTRAGLYYGHGFYLRSDNFIDKLPLFVAATMPYDRWYKTDVYSKTYDGEGSFLADENFLKKCLIYTMLTPKNKCRSLRGGDGRFYRNELCLDGDDTLGARKLSELGLELSDTEKTLMKYWSDVMFEAKKTTEYQVALQREPETRFGLWQIMEELNVKVPSGKKDRQGNDVLKYKYAALNTEVNKLSDEIRKYYDEELLSDCFKYQLLK
ncbi:MAG: hypothetical protein LBM09_01335 [Candidatus Nomurabacteria bacterium]|jgi:hypothetical protein|nr:hypothetical protein [Candidatus Nomurabacteria bacterium]